MANRGELVRLIHDTVCLCGSKPHRFVLSSRDLDAIANRLLAAYPQLAATELHVLRATTWNADGTPTPRRRTVYATPWEDDAP